MKIGGLVSRFRRWWEGRGVEEFTPSADDLRQLTEHLQYEVQMTFDLADVLNSVFAGPPATPLDQVLRNATLEAFTIHLRQMIDFFWSDRSPRRKLSQRDAFASDYFDPGEWKQLRPTRPPSLNRLLAAKVGWGVAHLTYGRAQSTPLDKQWVPVRLCAALAPTARLFLQHADPAKFDPAWFPHIQPVLDRFAAKYASVTP